MTTEPTCEHCQGTGFQGGGDSGFACHCEAGQERRREMRLLVLGTVNPSLYGEAADRVRAGATGKEMTA